MVKGFFISKMGTRGLHLSGPGQGQVAGCYEHRNEPSAFVKCGTCFDWLMNS